MTMPSNVTLVEVGPRDGLQNEKQLISTETKIELIERLGRTGLRCIEATSFVSPKWVPQMADAAQVLGRMSRQTDTRYPVLIPNIKGLEAALEVGVKDIAIFAAASESFSQKNINCSIADSLKRFEPMMVIAQCEGIRVRGYVSCVVGCPYEGAIRPQAVAYVSEALAQLGCYEVSLGDTIGIGTPVDIKRMIDAVAVRVPMDRLAGHYHDTYGRAIANIVASLEMGVSVFDASVAGLGGCPYAKGASGNVATEDVVDLLHRLGIHTGVDLKGIAQCAVWISEQLGRPVGSKLGNHQFY